MSITHYDPHQIDAIRTRVRDFFKSRGFLESSTQNRLSILAACEDPKTISIFDFNGEVWPLPQTQQMWLEHELLKCPTAYKGLFSFGTSYRNEPNPVPGRHQKIFEMIEWEIPGDMETLIQMETDLLHYLGFQPETFPRDTYANVAQRYNVKELEHEHENRIDTDYGNVFFLTDFPQFTHPFWNMKVKNNLAKKVDVIIHGQETIGSAERSCNKEEMRQSFYTISNGQYAKTLFNKFTRERVIRELEEFLSFEFVPRSGGGIGLDRLMRGMRLSKLF